jgi:hypothetical protein
VGVFYLVLYVLVLCVLVVDIYVNYLCCDIMICRMGPKKATGKAVPKVKRLQSRTKRVASTAEPESASPASSNVVPAVASTTRIEHQGMPTMQDFNDLKAQLQQLTSSLAASNQPTPAPLATVQPPQLSSSVEQQPTVPGPFCGVVPSPAGAVHQLLHAPQGETSTFSTLGANLDSRLTAKIISGQYIDLITLQQDEDKVVQFDLETVQWGLGQKANKKINNVFQWMRLFGTYASVLVGAKPAMGQALITYMIRVMDMQRQYPGTDAYLKYDVRFRQLFAKKEHAPHLCWEKVDTSILLDCLAGPSPLALDSTRPQSAGKPFRGGASGSRGTCFDFNKTGGCNRQDCRFVHKCQHWAVFGHGKASCFKLKGRSADTAKEAKQPETRAATNTSQRR